MESVHHNPLAKLAINFIILTIGFILILWLIKPAVVLVRDRDGYLDSVSWSKIIIYSMILAIITIGIVWFISKNQN